MKKSIINNNIKISHQNVIVFVGCRTVIYKVYAGRSRRLPPVTLPVLN